MYYVYKTETGRIHCSKDELDLNLHSQLTYIGQSDEYLEPNQWQLDDSDKVVPVVKDYQELRKYPKLADQLDSLWHDIDQGLLGAKAKTGIFYQDILAIKQQFPKTDK